MGQTVYVDLFFLINFSMDFLCFFLTARIMGGKLSLLRTVIASAIGGIYANIILFLSVPWGISLILDLAVCVAMCLVAFGGGGGIFRNTLAYIATSLVLGGTMTALFYLLDRAQLPLDAVESDGISAWLLAVLAALGAVCTVIAGRFFKRRTAKRYAEVTVVLGGSSKRLKGFCDSGNLLRDPISGKPCIIADVNAVADILPKGVMTLVGRGDVDMSGINDSEVYRRIRLIPTVSATGRAMTVALRVDKILIGNGREEREVDALLGLSVMGRADGDCQALVPTELLI